MTFARTHAVLAAHAAHASAPPDELVSPQAIGYEIDGRPLAAQAPLGAPPAAARASRGAAPLHRSAYAAWVAPGSSHLRVVGGPGAGESIAVPWRAHHRSIHIELRAASTTPASLVLTTMMRVADGSITVHDLGARQRPLTLEGRRFQPVERPLTPGSFLRLGSTTLTVAAAVHGAGATRHTCWSGPSST